MIRRFLMKTTDTTQYGMSAISDGRPTRLSAADGIIMPADSNGHWASRYILQLWLLHGTRQWASAKLCGVVQGMELRNFRSSSFSTEDISYIPRTAIALDIGPHSSLFLVFSFFVNLVVYWFRTAD